MLSDDPFGPKTPDEDYPGIQPDELVNLGNDCWVGIAYDDGCFVALTPKIDPSESYDPDRSNKVESLILGSAQSGGLE